MAKSGLNHIDVGSELTKTEWESEESHELVHGTSFPGSPVERQLFYRDDEHKWYIYDGTDWVWLGGGGMEVHGNEYHDPDFASEAALSSHEADEDAHHARYTDAEAVSAMGTKGDGNPLHHDRYTDAEAKAQAEGAKLDDHAAPDDNTDLDATASKHGLMPKADKSKLDGIEAGADVTANHNPKAHKASHQDGGSDEINVDGLSGELADPQPSNFLKLSDTPSSYSGQAGKVAKVKATEDGLEFGAGGGGGGTKIEDADADTKVDTEESVDDDHVRMDVAGVEAFDLDSDGILTLAKQSGARAYLSGGDQSIPDNTLTKVQLNTEAFDIRGEFDPSTNYRFTAKKAGIYCIAGNVTFSGMADGDRCNYSVYKNGAAVAQNTVFLGNSGNPRVFIVTLLALTANDYIEMYVWHDHGSAVNILDSEPSTNVTIVKTA